MHSTPFALVAVLLLAGCASTSLDEVLGPGGNPLSPAAFVRIESLVASDDGGAEPSLGVTPDGVLFTTLFANVYRSRDLGATWENLGDPAPLYPNNDPDLAVDIDGTVWESRLYGLVCNEASVSRDQGDSWTTYPIACVGPVHDRQYVIPTTGGEAYLYSHQLPTFQQLALKTTDYGATWIPTGPAEGTTPHHLLVNGGSGWGGGGFWNQNTGSVWFTFTYAAGLVSGTTQAGYSVTHDGGATWELAGAAALDGAQLGLGLVTGAADDAGNVYLTWGEAEGDAVSIWMAASRDDGATWQPKVRVDASAGSKVFPVLVAGEAGRVAIAYYEGSEAAFPDTMMGTWNVTLAYTDDALAATPTWSYGQLNSAPIKEGPICISGTTCTGDREFADYFDAVRMPDGRVAVTYNLLDSADSLRNGFALTEASLLGARPAAI
ncbi:MAG: hypothetical protein AABX89_02010 [Candidatus Thermoplasmatota archaeon]